jgi:RNA polymerase sigma-70 factor (ECF subfamily)
MAVALSLGMMRITVVANEESSKPRLRVEGRIVGDEAAELVSASAARLSADEPPILDFSGVSFIDATAARTVHALTCEGATIVGCSALVDQLLRTAGASEASKPIGDERSLVTALRRGDEVAFETLVRLYGGRMLAVARRMLRSEDDARDAVQEAFISACKAIADFQGDARLSTWLHRIVVNAALMRLRRQRRKPEESIDELLPHFDERGNWADVEQPCPTPFELLDQAETRAVVRECIDRLPDSYRSVVVLRDIEELDTDETAAALGMSVAAVKTRLHRGRQALRTLLLQRLGPVSPGTTRQQQAEVPCPASRDDVRTNRTD